MAFKTYDLSIDPKNQVYEVYLNRNGTSTKLSLDQYQVTTDMKLVLLTDIAVGDVLEIKYALK